MYKLLVIVLAILYTSVSHAYLYGYARLYRPSNGMTVDLLYDYHQPNNLTSEQMQQEPLFFIKDYLFPTELFVLETLEKLNSTNDARNCLLVWESCKNFICDESNFIGFAERLIFNRLRNLSYVYADRVRPHLETACIRGKSGFWGHDEKATFKGTSFDKPVRLSRTRIKQIIARSGYDVWSRLELLVKRVVNRFKNFGLEEFYELITTKRDQFPNEWNHFCAFSALADVEMLSHILSSSKKRVIVYCGGAHAHNIKKFLCESAHFSCIYERYTTDDVFSAIPPELNFDDLTVFSE